MAKSQVVETVERDGHQIAIYDNGMERDVTRGVIIRPPTSSLITKANAAEMSRKRQEKAARLLREAIDAETREKLVVPHNGTAAAIAAAGGILWREIVLGEDVYPRDRLDAYMKLGAVAGVIVNASNRPEPEKNTSAATDAAATALLNALREALTPRDVIDGKVTDTRATDAKLYATDDRVQSGDEP
jgi:hypothetical protein